MSLTIHIKCTTITTLWALFARGITHLLLRDRATDNRITINYMNGASYHRELFRRLFSKSILFYCIFASIGWLLGTLLLLRGLPLCLRSIVGKLTTVPKLTSAVLLEIVAQRFTALTTTLTVTLRALALSSTFLARMFKLAWLGAARSAICPIQTRLIDTLGTALRRVMLKLALIAFIAFVNQVVLTI